MSEEEVPKTPKKASRPRPKTECMSKRRDCLTKAFCRGLCRRCYQAYLWHVRHGKTTWATLERCGTCLASKQVRRTLKSKPAKAKNPKNQIHNPLEGGEA